MPKKASVQDKIGRVRPPRVQISYEVQVGDAIEMKELPFVLGVLADLSGQRETELAPLKDKEKRKFVEIDQENFNDVMSAITPHLAFKVDNKLTNDDTKMGADLRFKGIEDFEPEQVVNQVEPLRKLLEARRELSALLAKADGNDRLSEKLREIMNNTELLQQLGKETGTEPPKGEGEAKEG